MTYLTQTAIVATIASFLVIKVVCVYSKNRVSFNYPKITSVSIWCIFLFLYMNVHIIYKRCMCNAFYVICICIKIKLKLFIKL